MTWTYLSHVDNRVNDAIQHALTISNQEAINKNQTLVTTIYKEIELHRGDEGFNDWIPKYEAARERATMGN